MIELKVQPSLTAATERNLTDHLILSIVTQGLAYLGLIHG